MIEINLRKGMILTMYDLQAAYLWENSLKQTMSMHADVCYRKTLKPLSQTLIPEVEFHRPPKAKE